MVEISYPRTITKSGGTVDWRSFLQAYDNREGQDILAYVEGKTTESSSKVFIYRPDEIEIAELFATIRSYAQRHQTSVLELVAQYALDDLPISIAQIIRDYLEERKPQVKPGEVKFTGLFSSGRSDLSERMEEIIYGADSGDDE